jgi:transposase
MEDRSLYQQILGLASPWTVSSVKMDVTNEEIEVQVEHAPGEQFCCPECNRSLSCYDHSPARRWRHLDSCQFKTILVASIPRVECPEHGVKQVNVPWAEKSSRFTTLFERFAIDVLLATQTVKGAVAVLRISWDQAWHILQRAVKRGQARKVRQIMPKIGIDEKAFKKGHSYLTLLVDLENSTVESIAEGNDTDAGIACLSSLSEEQLQGVEAISMDMSAAYVKVSCL